MSEEIVRAAGGIVLRRDGDEPLVAVIHRPRYNDWSFPKGKLLDGELDETGALREVEEETGLRCRLGAHAGAVTYRDRHGRPKVVQYWTMTPEGGSFRESDEVDRLAWLPVPAAEHLLTYPHDRDLLRAVLGVGTQPPLYLVRHAKAGSRQLWSGPDEARPLTRRGRRQARRLVDRFHGLEIARVLSSPYVRCRQTVEPLADSRGLEVETSADLAEGADIEGTVALVRSLDATPTVLCGHGREIHALVRLFEDEGADVEGSRGLAKGSVWVLDRVNGGVAAARYLPAPPG